MDISALLDPFERLLAGTKPEGVMDAIVDNGFLDILLPEEQGGAALTLLEAEPLFRALGAHGVPAQIALAMVERVTGIASHELSAVVHAMLIAGGIERLLAMSVEYANTRVQFGKPIGKQQALQQQIARLAEQAAMVRVVAQYGAATGLAPSRARAAIAKYNASAAVPMATAVAHAVHGAIGITEEFPLQNIVKPLHIWRMADGSESYWARMLGEARMDFAEAPSVDFVRTVA